MKGKPIRVVNGRQEVCLPEEATHLIIHIPGPAGVHALPVILHGSRDKTRCWTWNGDTDRPTLRPSVAVTGHNYRCHTWINDGHAQFLDDCTHEFRGQTMELLDVGGFGEGEKG